MLGCDVILRAVRKLTREITALVKERVLPWYKGGRYEKVKTQFPPFYQGNTLSLTIGAISLVLTARKTSQHLSSSLGLEKPRRMLLTVC